MASGRNIGIRVQTCKLFNRKDLPPLLCDVNVLEQDLIMMVVLLKHFNLLLLAVPTT